MEGDRSPLDGRTKKGDIPQGLYTFGQRAMVDFIFDAPRKIIFGRHKSPAVAGWLREHGGTVLIISGNSIRQTTSWKKLVDTLKKEGVDFILAQISGEPSPDDIDRICRESTGRLPSALLAIGGGSVLDAGKAVAAMLTEPPIQNASASVQDYLEGVGSRQPSGTRLPFYALPTTAGTGSECTKNAVLSRPGENGFKKSLRHDSYIPDLAIVDSAWLDSLPLETAASCGMDAFSQLLESYLSTGASEMSDALALKGMEGFFQSFTPLLQGTASEDDLDRIALGACISGLTLANAGLCTVHALAGTLGGLSEISHGTACGTLLSPVMRRTFTALARENRNHPVLRKVQRLAEMIRKDESVSMERGPGILLNQIDKWAETASLPRLREAGMDNDILERTAETSGNKGNPYPFSSGERLEILKEVY